MRIRTKILCLGLCFALGGELYAERRIPVQAAVASELEAEFRNPPSESKMGVYWWCFGPALTREEITRELELMQKAGIGTVLLYPLYLISVF